MNYLQQGKCRNEVWFASFVTASCCSNIKMGEQWAFLSLFNFVEFYKVFMLIEILENSGHFQHMGLEGPLWNSLSPYHRTDVLLLSLGGDQGSLYRPYCGGF